MKYIKKFEASVWEPKDNIQGLKEIFNLVLPDPEVFKIPYSYRNSKSPDFYIYVVSGVRSERDDHKFLQELYHNHEILNDIYNLEFYNITLSKNKTYATIVLYDYIMDPNYNKNVKNYISSDIIEGKLPLPSNIKERLKTGMLYKNHSYYLTKGILYSNGNSGNMSLFDWIYENTEDYRKQYEDINVPIKVGDTILGGRFKNKKIVVKKIGKNKKGDITVNDKPLLKFRLLKESISQEDIDNGLAYLKDDGFQVIKKRINKYNDIIEIFKLKESNSQNTNYGTMAIDNIVEVNWSDIESDLLPFIEINRDSIKEITITIPVSKGAYDRRSCTPDSILEDIYFDRIIKVTIISFKDIIPD